MAKTGQLARPMMRSATGLQRHHTAPLRRKEPQQLGPTDLLAEHRAPALIRAVRVKNMLGDIQTNRDNFVHGRLPQVKL